MNGPPRLIESTDPELRALLAAALGDEPRSNLLPDLRSTLGVSSLALIGSSGIANGAGNELKPPGAPAGTLPGSAPTTTGIHAGTIATVSGSGALITVKSLLLLALVGGALSVGVVIGRVSARLDQPAATHPAVAPAVAPNAASNPTSTVGTPPIADAAVDDEATDRETVALPSLVNKPHRAAGTNAHATRAAGAEPVDSSLHAEVQRIDLARHALHSGDARAALAALDEYRAASPRGVLQREAQWLRIEALSQLGNQRAVRQLAAKYLAFYPSDAHAKRMRELLNILGNGQDPPERSRE